MGKIIEFNEVSYSYELRTGEKISAIKNVSFEIDIGERLAIIGANGSGKSTAAKLMNGLLFPDKGRVLIDGNLTIEKQYHAENFSKIGLVFQNPHDQIIASLVEEDTAFGPENLALPFDEIHRRVNDALEKSASLHLRQRQSYLLSAGETQRVALAGVLAMEPKCIIFDETTAMLDPISRTELLDLMQSLHKSGITIIHITHNMDEALLADRLLVFKEGQILFDDKPESIFHQSQQLEEIDLDIPYLLQFAQDLTEIFSEIKSFYKIPQDLLDDLYLQDTIETAEIENHIDTQQNDSMINVNQLEFSYLQGTALERKALSDLTFCVPEFSTLGLVGSTGSGKSTLLQHLNGIYRPQAGSVIVDHFDLNDSSINIQELRKKVALVFQQPEEQFFEIYVGDEIAYAARNLGYEGKLTDIVKKAMQAVELDFEKFKDRPLSTLSGGQKRRVALASYIVIQPDVYLLDEPFAGLDPKTHQRLSKFVLELNKKGRTIVLSTHDMRDVAEICQNVLMLENGKKEFDGNNSDFFDELERKTYSLKPPLEIQIANLLNEKGYAIPHQALIWKEIFSSIKKNREIKQ